MSSRGYIAKNDTSDDTDSDTNLWRTRLSRAGSSVRPQTSKVVTDSQENLDVLPNEISAPHEIPRFPIEQIERSLQIQRRLSHRRLKLMGDTYSTLDGVTDEQYALDEKYFDTNYQRASILSESTDDGLREEFKQVSASLIQALELRLKYMNNSQQSFPRTALRFLKNMEDIIHFPNLHQDRKSIAEYPIHPPRESKDPWELEFPPDKDYTIKAVDGVFHVYKDKDCQHNLDYEYTKMVEFYKDMRVMCKMIENGPIKSFCYNRLCYLSSKFQLHELLNEWREAFEAALTTRDFYNTHKVDTHIHAAACMNQKHLLRFIKQTLKNSANEVVIVTNGQPMTMSELFQSLKLTKYDLTVDMLDMHADRNTFHRFDTLNAKNNPIGETRLHQVFLTADNHLNGKYFAQLIKEVAFDLDESKYQHAELRLCLNGKSPDEWQKLAKWAIDHNVYSKNIRWLIQIPRFYDILKLNQQITSFQEFLNNIFLPLFKATNNPSKHPELHRFMQYVIGFDSIDDESTPENPLFHGDIAPPQNWTEKHNPPYAYYIYYMYANMTVLNKFRAECGLNTFVLRPRCGETGPVQHLVSGFLMAEHISLGLLLRKVPVLQYLYYLAQIGIAMSPLSNNLLFLNYNDNPLPDYLARGLKVSLSTDAPLQFHYTKEPLMEEYSIATQLWKLSACDMSELSRNSVSMSGFPHKMKQHWLGPNYMREGVAGNDINRTNVPDIRVSYRTETLRDELSNIFKLHQDPVVE